MNYDVDYFLRKFEAIPEELWTTYALYRGNGQRCALGHCLVTPEQLAQLFSEESIALCNVISCADEINNGRNLNYQQPTPKQRILAALRDIQAKENAAKAPEVKERIVYVMRDAAVKELQQKELCES